MIELLILYVLLEEKCTLYRIKQKIEEKFSLFLSISFGAIHPIIKKLEKNQHISVKKSLSLGGQRKSLYKITESGKDRFLEIMGEPLPKNPSLAEQLINLKIIMTSIIEEKFKQAILDNIAEYIKSQKIKALEQLKEVEENKEKENILFFEIFVETLDKKIEFIKLLKQH